MLSSLLILVKVLWAMNSVPRWIHRKIYGRIDRLEDLTSETHRLGNRMAVATVAAWAILLSACLIPSYLAGELRGQWALLSAFGMIILVLPGCAVDLTLIDQDEHDSDPGRGGHDAS